MENKFQKMQPILIVEDTRINQHLLQSFCNSLKIKSMIANNGEEALKLLEKFTFSLYIIDLIMPVMDGKTFIAELKNREPEAIILIQTAIETPGTIIELLKLGIFDYILKPVTFQSFKNAVIKGLEFKRLHDYEKNYTEQIRSEISKVRGLEALMRPEFKIKGFDSAFSILPAEDLSGDFLDGFYLNEHLYQVILADVSGHGIASSYIGTNIKSMFRAFTSENISPSELISKVNKLLSIEMKKISYFATVVVLNINTKNGEVQYASGGHHPALLCNSGSGKCVEIKGSGPLIGLFENPEYKTVSFTINKGETLLLYTDGVTEPYSSDGSIQYGEERLQDVFIDSIENPSIDIIHSILDSLYTFTDYALQDDDITIVCIKN